MKIKHIVASLLLLAGVALGQSQFAGGVGGSSSTRPASSIDIRDYYSATGVGGLTADFGLAISNIFTKWGSGVSVDYSGLCPSNGGGIVTVYANTNPWHGVANSFSSYHRFKCNVQWITSVSLNWPSTGSQEMEGPPSIGNAAQNTGFSLEPCATVGGCGPNLYPVFPFFMPATISVTSFTGSSGTLTFTNSGTNGLMAGMSVFLSGFSGGNTGLNSQSVTVLAAGLTSTTFQAVVTGSGYSTGTGSVNVNPTAGTAACVGPPGPACTTYTTGTAAFTDSSGTVTGVGTTWTSQMVGGLIYSGLGAQASACVGYIRSVNSPTSITLANNPKIANCGILAGSGVQGTYTILQPNANILLWVGSGSIEVGGTSSSNTGLNSNCFSQTFRQFRVDLEGMPLGIGKYTTNCQENFTDWGSQDSLNYGHQGASNHGFADVATTYPPPLAGIMFDNYYLSTTGSNSGGASHESIYDVTVNNFQEPAANCANGNSYGFVFQGWSFMNATSKGGANNIQFSTINGNVNCSFTDSMYLDGVRGNSPINVGHIEYFSEAGIHAGANNKTEVNVNVGNAANIANGTIPVIWFDTNASTNNKGCANAITTGKILLKDTVNTTIFNGATSISSTSNTPTACEDQTANNYVPRLFRGLAYVKATSQTAAITTSTLCAATANSACGQAGQYRLHLNEWGSGTACATVTAGSTQFQLAWTDENAVAHLAAIPVFDNKSAAMGTAFNFNTTLATEGASGDYLFSTNGTIIQYSTTYVACTSGTGTYNLRATITQEQ